MTQMTSGATTESVADPGAERVSLAESGEVAKIEPAVPRGRHEYQIIYCDPGWQYRDRAKAGNRGAESKYTVTPINQLAALDVPDLAAENCYIFMWATCPMLREALYLIERWGFVYKTVAFTWVKTCTKNPEKDFFGMGHYTRANSEFVLLGTKGRLNIISKSVRQVVRSPRLPLHSQKPPEVRQRIVELLGDLPRIELFARERVPGWDAWGNQVESDIVLHSSLANEENRGPV